MSCLIVGQRATVREHLCNYCATRISTVYHVPFGGEFADETLKGRFTVNSDCSGTLTADVFESGKLVRTSVFSIVFDDHMKEVRAVQQSLTLPDGTTVLGVITVEGKKTLSSGEQD
jgi:hypothetical protein